MCNDSSTQNWQYPRNQLVYMRELGEGQFGKVLLMKAQVCNYLQLCSLYIMVGAL